MNRKMTYIFSLLGFFLMWGVFGFATAAPPAEPVLQVTVPPVEATPISPGGTDPAGIPVTGEPERVWSELFGFYGLIGFAALFLILALLSLANKSTAPAVQRKVPSSEETRED